jgi:hypothetical protein
MPGCTGLIMICCAGIAGIEQLCSATSCGLLPHRGVLSAGGWVWPVQAAAHDAPVGPQMHAYVLGASSVCSVQVGIAGSLVCPRWPMICSSARSPPGVHGIRGADSVVCSLPQC